MSFIQQFFTSRDNNANAETFVGQEGRLWWDPVSNQIYSSDGSTPGGIPLAGGGGGNGTPGGSNSQVQFNQNSTFGGTANVTIDRVTGALTAVSLSATGNVNAGNINVGSAFTGNILPSVDNTYFLGDATHRWANLWLGPGTIYITDTGNIANVAELTVSNGVLFVNGAAGLQANLIAGNTTLTLANNGPIVMSVGGVANVWSVNSTGVQATGTLSVVGNINTSGNTTSTYYFGNGSQLTGITATSANSATYAVNITGNAQPNITSVGTLTSVTSTGNISTTGNVIANYVIASGGNTVINSDISTTGNVVATYFKGDGSLLTGIAPTVQVYEFANINSGISTYLTAQWLADYTPTAAANIVTTISTTGTLLASFITQSGYPNVTVIPVGTMAVTIELTKTAGSKSYVAYAQIYKRTTGGTETLIATTDNSSAIAVNTAQQITLSAYFDVPVSLNATDRIVTKIYAYTSQGTDVVTFKFEDNTNTGLQLPALPASASSFVPYNNPTANLNMDGYGVTASFFSANGNVTGNYIFGNGSALTSINGANITGTVANATYATTSGSATTATSATTAATVTTNAQPNITSVGTLTSVTVTGNTTSGNLLTGGLISASGNITGGNIVGTHVGNLTGTTISVTGNVTGGNLISTGAVYSNYNTNTANTGSFMATGGNTKGGTGYLDFLTAQNTSGGATNPYKWFRVNNTGGLEIINSAYTATIFNLTDAGGLNLLGPISISGKQAVNGPAFRAYIAVNQAITSGSQQKVTFGSETFDTNGNFASSRFTPTVEGYYQLNATVRIGGISGTSECMITIWKNGAEYARGTNESGTEQGASFYSMQVSDLAYANGSTDYFEIYIQQGSGSNKDTTAGQNISYFSGAMIRGA